MSSGRWIGYFARLAALTAALFIGSDAAEAQCAGGSTFGAAALAALTSLVSAASENSDISETSETTDRQSNLGGYRVLSAQAGPQTFPGGSLSGLFSRGGLLGGFAAGFLGCGLFGILFGRGLLGDLDGAPSYFGLFVQLALLAMLCWLIWTRWRGGDAAEHSALSPRQLAAPYLRSRDDLHARFEAPAEETHVAGAHDEPSQRPAEVTDASGKRD